MTGRLIRLLHLVAILLFMIPLCIFKGVAAVDVKAKSTIWLSAPYQIPQHLRYTN